MKRWKVLSFMAGATIVGGFSSIALVIFLPREQQVVYAETPVLDVDTASGKDWSDAMEQKQQLAIKLAEDIYGLEALVNWTSRITLYFSNLNSNLSGNDVVIQDGIQEAFTSRLRLSSHITKLKAIYEKVGVEWKDEYGEFMRKLDEYRGEYEAIANKISGFDFVKSLEELANKMKSAKHLQHSNEIIQLHNDLKSMSENRKILTSLKGG